MADLGGVLGVSIKLGSPYFFFCSLLIMLPSFPILIYSGIKFDSLKLLIYHCGSFVAVYFFLNTAFVDSIESDITSLFSCFPDYFPFLFNLFNSFIFLFPFCCRFLVSYH